MVRYEDITWRDSMRIRFDYTNMLADAVGDNRGATQAQLDEMEFRLSAAMDVLRMRRGPKDLAWMELPYQEDTVQGVLSYAREVEGVFDDILVLGIGGSALGVTALTAALLPFYSDYQSHEERRHPRLFVLDNVDPDWVMPTLQLLDPGRTLCIASSRSGTTTETLAQFLIVREWLRQALGEATPCHVVTITGSKGPLREIAGREGYRTFSIPEGVGGRFSVLSPVGLVPAALVGIDVQELLAGAAYADQSCSVRALRKNPAGMNAALQRLAYDRGQRISVLMPYSQQLHGVADWFRQLWAESLGKKMNTLGRRVHVGPTPVLALGATDQHSQIQLYVEGPPDKIINLVAVERFAHEGPIPPPVTDEESELGFLGGHTLAELINAEREATTAALTEAGRPNATHILPEVNPFTIGQLLYMLQMQTAIAALLFAVDAYDQPGVEAGKAATYALLGRPGYEEQAIAMRTAQAARPRHVI